MKLDKLDFAVFIIVALCLAGVATAAFLTDPARQPTRVAYLYPASAAQQNVFMADIANPAAHEQLTHSQYGVYDFDISPDGRWLAFSDRAASATVTLRLLDIPARREIDLVDCVALNAYCTSPVFSADGKTLAYQRAESTGTSYGLSRIWLVDMSSASYDSAPLIADTQVVGHSALWSLDSNTVAFYSADRSQPGILIFDFVPRGDDDIQLRFIPTSHGTMGTLSPNGQQIIFPELVRRGDQFFTHLQIADLAQKTFAAFTDPEGPTDDAGARWSPDGETVALARRYLDDRWTQGLQVYLRRASDPEDALTPIAHDPRYNSSYVRWNGAGDKLAMQRFPLRNEDGSTNRLAQPEVWVHDLASGATLPVVADAYLPEWVSG